MSNVNETQIHAHEVLHLVDQNDGKLSQADLLAKVEAAYGSDARFYACFDQNLKASDLLIELILRGKLEEENGKLFLCRQNMC